MMRGDSSTPGVETILHGYLVNPDFSNSSTSLGYSAAQIFICSTISWVTTERVNSLVSRILVRVFFVLPVRPLNAGEIPTMGGFELNAL